MRAVIIGATGATGKALLEQLIQDPAITTVTALVRRNPELIHRKLESILVDFDHPEQWAPLVQGDLAFSCMGTTLKAAGSKEGQYKVDYEYQYAFAQAAAAASIPRFVLVSAAAASPQSPVFYSRIKGELELGIRALSFKHLIIFRPGMLSRPGTDRIMEKRIEGVLKFLNRLGLFKNMAPLAVDRLARLMLRYGLQVTAEVEIIGAARLLKEQQHL
ncbi:NAD(P)H-binding protein [Niabella terrae]